jgi:hypothetical protein
MLTFPSVYQLLPSYQNCCAWRRDKTIQVFSSADPRAWRRFSWVPDELRRGTGPAALDAMLEETNTLHTLMRKQQLPVRAVNVVTGLLDTQWKTFFSADTGEFLDTTPYPGDGTVIEWSAANGVVGEARASTTEHGTIFDADSARTVLRWILGTEIEPTKGLPLDFRAELQDNTGRGHKLMRLSYRAEPQVATGGEPVEFSVDLIGETSLATADLNNVTVRLLGNDGEVPRSLVAGPATIQGQTSERRIQLGLPMPTAPGTHVLELNLPGVGVFTEVLFATK